MHPRRVPPPPQIIKPPKEAEGVSYFTHEGAGEKRFFACVPMRATMSQGGCGARWREAQATGVTAGDRWAACRGCTIGAAHAGERAVHYSAHYGASVCPRCGKHAGRMIGGTRCVSCYNRERELATGRNARGNPPIVLQARRTLHPVAYRLSVDGVISLRRPLGVSLHEPVLHTMRTVRGDVVFGFAGPVHLLRQGRLFG